MRRIDALGSGLSLRLRLTLWMLTISLVLQVALGLVLLAYQRASIGRFLDARALDHAASIAEDIPAEAGFALTDNKLDELADFGSRSTLFERDIVTLYDSDGNAVASTVRPAPDASRVGLDRASDAARAVYREPIPDLDRETPSMWRVVLLRLRAPDGRTFTLLVAGTNTYLDEMMGLTVRVLAFAIVIGLAATGIAGWMIAGTVTAPLSQLRQIAGSLAPETIEQGLELPVVSREVASLQKDLQDVRSKLLQALHAQDRFISNVSHELKTPIAVLLTEAQILRLERLPNDARDFVQSVTEEMRRLGRTVESFLTLTKLRGGKGLVNPTLCAVNDFVMEAIASSGKMARQYHVALVPDLAVAEPYPLVSGDAELLRVMVENLVRNAIRFSPEHQKVLIHIREEGNECTISVHDRGPGAPEELIDKLFDRFVQASEETTRGRGHGLGLSIAQGIAELHGGRIAVKNDPDGGCEFIVRLPLAGRHTDSSKTTFIQAPKPTQP